MSLVCFAEYNICKHEVLIWFGSLFRSNNVLSKCVSFAFFYFFVAHFWLPEDNCLTMFSHGLHPLGLQASNIMNHGVLGPCTPKTKRLDQKMDGPLDYCNRSFSFWKPACSGSILVCKDFWLMFYLSSYFFKYGDGTSWKFNGWQIHFAYGTGHRILPLHGYC